MSKAIKFGNDIYLDTSGSTNNRRTLDKYLVDTGWVSLEPYLQDNFIPWSAELTVYYRKVDNIVYLRGLFKSTVDITDTRTIVLKLPDELRPQHILYFPVACSMNELTYGNKAYLLTIYPSGDVVLHFNTLPMERWVSLSGIIYLTD